MHLTNDQKNALNVVLKGHSIFIGGQAGVGKSFLIERIFNEMVNRGKQVALTCTTGIACSNFPKELHAMTVHKWSGIGDGRYEDSILKKLLLNDEKYADASKRIINTDVLIVDEISMLSLSQYNKLENICHIRNEEKIFGGIQVILVGDFYQLPPVPNARYGDLGQFCFTSDFFPGHHVYLREVMRQSNRQLIKLVREFSSGHCSNTAADYVQTLSRPLKDESTAVRLFANNMLVNMHNRDYVLKLPGQLYVFEAIDSGSKQDLEPLVVQQTLWLKVGAPVMLLRNLSDRLVNGLRGTVIGVGDEKVSVNFPSISQMAELTRISFTVFDSTKNRNIAERLQIPLKLAYALTVHKAQGMTMDKVIVDCRRMFAPGQLAVAISRVQTEDGLRVVNFSMSSVIKQPQKLEDFAETESAPFTEDLACCTLYTGSRRDNSVQQVLPAETYCGNDDNADIDFEGINETEGGSYEGMKEKEGDTELECILSEWDDDITVDCPPKPVLPAQYQITVELSRLKFKNPDTQFQLNVNKLIEYLSANIDTVEQFCEKQWHELVSLYEKTIKEEGKGVPQSCFHQLYQNLQKYMTGNIYKQNCALLYYNIPDALTVLKEEQYHICFNIVVSLRVLLLKIKSDKLPICTDHMSKRSMSSNLTDTARGKLRYIGGYVIAKIRYAHCKSIKSNCNKTSAHAITNYEFSKYALEILDVITVSEYDIIESSKDKGSLQETSRKQNINRGLTNISDKAYLFFTDLTEEILKLLSGFNISIYGSHLYSHVYDKLFSSIKLYEAFCGICHTECMYSCENEVKDILSFLTYKVEVMEVLYKEILQKILALFLKQFMRDMHITLHLGKKMEHRKQIQVSKTGGKRKKTSSGIKTIDKETPFIAEACVSSSHVLPGPSRSENQSDLGPSDEFYLGPRDESNPGPSDQSNLGPSDQSNLGPSDQFNLGPSDQSNLGPSDQFNLGPSDQSNLGPSDQYNLGPSDQSNLGSDADNTCGKCEKLYKEDEDWIQCDFCMKWFHRMCVGINKMAVWKRITKSKAKYACPECK